MNHKHWSFRLPSMLSAVIASTMCFTAAAASEIGSFDWEKRISALGGEFPGDVPRLFGESGISEPGRYEYGSTFSPDGELFFFGVDLGGRTEIRVVRWEDGEWTDSKTFLTGETASYNDPIMSLDGERLYFITDQESDDGSFDIAYVERTDTGWSQVQIASGISTQASEYFWSESSLKEQYFARNIAPRDSPPNFDIFHESEATPAEGLALTSAINSPYYEGDPFVSEDGSTLVFVSNRPGGAGRGDLYVSFRSSDGRWQTAIPLDHRINTTAHELTPYITPDGEWLLFSRDGDIYWVSTSLLDSLRVEHQAYSSKYLMANFSLAKP